MRGSDGSRGGEAEGEMLAAALREAGAIALKTFRTPVRSWLKEQASPVSEADIAVDQFLRARLAGSGCGWLSEESAEDRSSREAQRLWIVDPIDGTRSYLAGRPDWVISVALVADGRPILAGVFAPATDEMFMAVSGAGATRNGVPIRVAAGDQLSGATIAGPKRFVQVLTAAHAQIVVVPRIGSLALRLVRVAQGELDVAFASASSHDWDLAAADLLVHEAGGAVTNLVGRRLTYNQSDLVHGALVAAGADRHAALLTLTREWLSSFG